MKPIAQTLLFTSFLFDIQHQRNCAEKKGLLVMKLKKVLYKFPKVRTGRQMASKFLSNRYNAYIAFTSELSTGRKC